jgi:hypothetical protein
VGWAPVQAVTLQHDIAAWSRVAFRLRWRCGSGKHGAAVLEIADWQFYRDAINTPLRLEPFSEDGGEAHG